MVIDRNHSHQFDRNKLDLKSKTLIDRGSHGVVSRCHLADRSNKTVVAVKEFKLDKEDKDKEKFFLRELEALKACGGQHSNLVMFYGHYSDPTSGVETLVFEYAPFGSLKMLLHGDQYQGVNYTIGHVFNWLQQCASAVAFLHAQRPKPLVHRDLKPGNCLMFDRGRTLKVTDFGLTKTLTHSFDNTAEMGTPCWMAPEIYVSDETDQQLRYNEKCDVFSIGIMTWEMLVRDRPFKMFQNTYQIMYQVGRNNQRPPDIDGCPPSLESLIKRCWQKDPSLRPPMAVVERFFQGLVDQLRPDGQQPLEDYEELLSNRAQLLPDLEPTAPPTLELVGPSSSSTLPTPADFGTSLNAEPPIREVYLLLEQIPEELRPIDPMPEIPLSEKLNADHWAIMMELAGTMRQRRRLQERYDCLVAEIMEQTDQRDAAKQQTERFEKLVNENEELQTECMNYKTMLESEEVDAVSSQQADNERATLHFSGHVTPATTTANPRYSVPSTLPREAWPDVAADHEHRRTFSGPDDRQLNHIRTTFGFGESGRDGLATPPAPPSPNSFIGPQPLGPPPAYMVQATPTPDHRSPVRSPLRSPVQSPTPDQPAPNQRAVNPGASGNNDLLQEIDGETGFVVVSPSPPVDRKSPFSQG